MSGQIQKTLPTQRQPFVRGLPPEILGQGIQDIPRERFLSMPRTAGAILQDAVFYIASDEHQADNQPPKTVRNKGTAGASLDIKTGSTSVADTNDPKFLDFTGTPYVYLPGVASNYLSSPDAAVLRITGDIDLRAQIDADAWASASQTEIINRYTAAGNLRSYRFGLNVSGGLFVYWSTDGTTTINKSSTINLPFTQGKMWVRATIKVNNGSAGNDVNFYYSSDGSSWTQLGTTVTTAGVTSIFAGTSIVAIGTLGDGTTQPIPAKIYRAQIYNGIAGTLVFDADTSVITSGSATSFVEKSANAATVTINRSTSGKKSVAVVAPVWLFGTSIMRTAGTAFPALAANGQDVTIFAAIRQWATPQNNLRIVDINVAANLGGNASGIMMHQNGTATQCIFATTDVFATQTGNNVSGQPTPASGALQTNAGMTDVQAGKIRNYINSVATTGLESSYKPNLTNAGNQIRIGCGQQGTSNQDMELVAIAIWRRTLSQGEVTALDSYFQGKWV